MKAVLALAALLQLSAAQPHRHQHQHLHKRAGVVADVVTQVDVVTAVAPDVIVIVNQFGEPIATSYGKAAATPVSEAVAAVSSVFTSSAAAAAVTSTVKHGVHAPPLPSSIKASSSAVVVKSSAAPVSVAPSSSAAASSSASASGSGSGSGIVADTPASENSQSSSGSGSASLSGLGIAYSPYNTDGSCKTQDQVDQDFDVLGSKGYGSVRIYNVDCEQVVTVGNAAKSHNMKVFAGIYDLSDVAGDVQLLIQGVANDWAGIDTVNICNECVNSGTASVAEIVAALAIARPLLRAAGFTGSIVTVDTFVAMIANPELCEASDYAAVNAHAFFDSDTAAAQAGQWLQGTVTNVQNACNGKKVVVTESGWPSNGQCNGAACPSEANQQSAISSIKSAFSQDVFLFSGFNDGWKVNNAGTFGAEQYWGVYGGSPSSPFPA